MTSAKLDGRTVYGVTGHRHNDSYQKMRKAAEQLAKMACDENAILSIGAAGGWDLEVMRQCLHFQVQYILRLAFKSRLVVLNAAFTNKRRCVLITWEADRWREKKDNRFFFERNYKIIEDARNSGGFYKKLHAYWDYRAAGGTFKCIEKALERNVIVTNWFDNNTLRTMKDLKGVKQT